MLDVAGSPSEPGDIVLKSKDPLPPLAPAKAYILAATFGLLSVVSLL